MMKRIAFLLTVMLPAAGPSLAQLEDAARTLDPESIAEADELEPGALVHAADYLAAMADDPLDLNKASAADLARLPGLAAHVAQGIVVHRRQNGPFVRIEQILQVEGMDADALAALRPFVRIRPPQRQRLSLQLIQRAGRRLDVGRGYDADTLRTTYLGDPWRVYSRLTVRYGKHFQTNITLEKDPGERFQWLPEARSYGFDFASGGITLRDLGPIRLLVAGDFALDYGLGLALSRGAAIRGGGATFRNRVRIGSGIVPYASSDENRFMRGIAASIAVSPAITASAFASRRRLDASYVQLDDGQYLPRAPVQTGYHRTENERGQKGAIGHSVYGGAITYAGEGALQVGVAGYVSRFSDSFHTAGEPYRHHAFTGADSKGGTAYATLLLGSALLFAEASAAAGRTAATRAGALVRSGRTEALVEMRNAPPRYESPHGLVLGGAGGNERGLVAALKLEPAPGWTMFATLDQSSTPWVRYSVPRPSTGHSSVAGITHKPQRWLQLRAEIRSRTRESAIKAAEPAGRLLDAVAPASSRSIRLEAEYTFSSALRFRARVDRTRATGPRTALEPEARQVASGTLVSHDVHWSPSAHFRLSARLAFFDVDDYTARVFTYEDDLLYTFSVPSFSGRGQRTYLVGRVVPSENLSLEFKYAHTRYEDVLSVGSGLDETAGHLLREARAQIRWKL